MGPPPKRLLRFPLKGTMLAARRSRFRGIRLKQRLTMAGLCDG